MLIAFVWCCLQTQTSPRKWTPLMPKWIPARPCISRYRLTAPTTRCHCTWSSVMGDHSFQQTKMSGTLSSRISKLFSMSIICWRIFYRSSIITSQQSQEIQDIYKTQRQLGCCKFMITLVWLIAINHFLERELIRNGITCYRGGFLFVSNYFHVYEVLQWWL